MPDGLATALGVIGLLVLLEVLDITGLFRRKIRGETSGMEQDSKIADLEQRVGRLEQVLSPGSGHHRGPIGGESHDDK
jgi:hypothetical protein